jgi:hypothetical protein
VNTQVDLGAIASSVHPRGASYYVDLRRGVQVSSRGFAREVLVVPQPHQKDAAPAAAAARAAPPAQPFVSKLLKFQCITSGAVHPGEGGDEHTAPGPVHAGRRGERKHREKQHSTANSRNS